MRRNLVVLLMGIFSSSLTAPTAWGANILFMHNPAAGWVNDIDFPLIEYFESLGHEVTSYDTSVNDPDEQIDLATSHDLVFVAETLGSATMHDGLESNIKDVPTPQIWAEAYAWDEAALVADVQFEDFGNTLRTDLSNDELWDGQTEMNIILPNHPLAAGFTGKVKVYEDDYSLNYGLVSTLGAGATVIATVDDAHEYASYFAYEPGAALEDGTPAAGLRIALWLGQADQSGVGTPMFDNVSADGQKLLKAAVDYALGLTGTPGDFDGNGALDVQDIDALTVAVRANSSEGKYDLNGDSRVDDADRTVWVETLKTTYFGDSNLDGEFNSGDFVAVFTVGKYELDTAATWGEGDWNGDNRFNSSDFVTAFSAGGYEQGARASIASVPEPAAAQLWIGGLAGFVGCWQWTRSGRRSS